MNWRPLLAECKSFNWEGLGDARKAIEMDLSSYWIVQNNFTNWRPKHQLLSLDTVELLYLLLLLNITMGISVIDHELADLPEYVCPTFFC